jgi:predicted lipid-binding transport protein (Tim44 family)
MKRTSIALAFVATLGLAALDSEAAKRFGGGGNVGKQRAAPAATKDAAPAAAPAQAAPAQTATPAPAAAGAAPAAAAAAKPSFMSRWGGLLAGLGIGVLLASLFGAQLGPIIGLLLVALLVGLVGFALFRLFAAKRAPQQQQPRPVQFAGIGSAIQAPPGDAPAPPAAAVEPAQRRAISIPGFEVAPFVRVAKTSFIRLQAANDSGDLEDIRDYTTPEIYAEIAMQLKERQGTQKTEVVSLDADVVEAVIEDGHEIASVRFWGLIRENDASNPEPFDELWHVRRKAGDRKAPWLIAGIQQAT